ncbi:hypothetical protein BPMI_02696c [Candidatus Burkholderia pumila]|uniref:Transmembrane protein n=1 Tax=Candidatus Burkholderia pumila TaxID=1090375 RepID=A0ABR5HN41_9BURK|nr:hypothetical protein BPMI_02696c [Candidatus Burkholderia pumila]
MKPLLSATAAATAAVLAAASFGAFAQQSVQPVEQPVVQKPMSPEEAVGLPDLKAINRPPTNDSSKVEISPPRQPSFHKVSGNGTEITEYRDKGKPVEINVHSNFGTSYSMSVPVDTSPQVRDNGKASMRLPSINLRY